MAHEAARLVASNNSSSRGRYTYNETDKNVPTDRFSIQAGENSVEYEKETPLLSGDFLKSLVFGGLDGLITTLAIISGAAGGQFSWHIVLVMGFSTIAANALSLGAGEYLSSKAHREFIQVEKRRETWEFKHFKDVEMREMVMRFVSRGMGKADAELVVTKMAQYENFFVNLMVTEELGLQLPEDNDAKLLTDAFIMTLAFAVFGCLPLTAYCFGQWDFTNDLNMFYAACCIAASLLFMLGSLKSCFCTVFWFYSGLETVVVAGAASTVAYALGSLTIRILSK